MLGVGSSQTREAKKARDIMSKEIRENLDAEMSLADTQGVIAFFAALLGFYYLLFGLIGFDWRDGTILGLIFYILFPIVPSIFLGMYITKKLNELGGRWSRLGQRVTYWMCRSCGKEFKV